MPSSRTESLIFSSEENGLPVARLTFLTVSPPRLLVVFLIFRSSVVTVRHNASLINLHYLTHNADVSRASHCFKMEITHAQVGSGHLQCAGMDKKPLKWTFSTGLYSRSRFQISRICYGRSLRRSCSLPPCACHTARSSGTLCRAARQGSPQPLSGLFSGPCPRLR